MNKISENELLSIVERYGYTLIDKYSSLKAVKLHPKMESPVFGGGDRYWQLKHIAAWIMETEEE